MSPSHLQLTRHSKQLVRIQYSNQRLYFPRIQIVYGSQSYTSKATVSNFSSEPKGGIGTKEGRRDKKPRGGWERALFPVFSGLQTGCVPIPEDQLWKNIKAPAPRSHQLEQKGNLPVHPRNGSVVGGTQRAGINRLGFFFL